jgi:hypothetical protein
VLHLADVKLHPAVSGRLAEAVSVEQATLANDPIDSQQFER